MSTAPTSIPADPYSTHTPAREQGNQYALTALRERRAFMTGELIKLEERRRFLKESITHIDATISLMAPGTDPTLIKARYPRRKAKLFGAGKLNHFILGVMRKADRPMTQGEVTLAVVEAAGFDASDPQTVSGMRPRVRANLLYLTKVRGLLVKDGEREGAAWTIK